MRQVQADEISEGIPDRGARTTGHLTVARLVSFVNAVQNGDAMGE